MNQMYLGPTETRPHLSELEIKAVREGIDGIKGMMPARFYYDQGIYDYEVEHILKKNWLCVGRWDWAKEPGDYFTARSFGEPILIIRDREGELHALVNVCQHRWAQVVPDGAGKTQLLVCPYHSWTYELDGRLRGVSVQDVPNFDKSTCRMPSLRLEVWKGFVFINFDPDAAALGPQLTGLDALIGRFGVGEFKTGGRTDYDTTWNYKFSFETGYEAYHHEGVHKSILAGTAHYYHPLAYGEIWGAYGGAHPTLGERRPPHPFGPPPWLAPNELESFQDISIFVAVYPNLITFINSHQVTYITTEFQSVDANRATTANAFAPWAWERPNAQAVIAGQIEMMKAVQDQDTAGCRMLQGGIRSSYNRRSIVHPLEPQLSHYYNWMLDQYLA
jgi:phenylpropionate dioxygenase-like ring-hydroxylating dioxygenase large terminal subunit